jgi:phage tail sheath protein FI
MGFQVSPGVEVKEVDLTNVIPAVSTSIGGYAGHFSWGPAEKAVLVSSEKELSSQFGIPTGANANAGTIDNYTSFLTAASFLKYTNALQVSRAKPASARNAVFGLKGIAQAVQTSPLTLDEDASTDSTSLFHGRYFGAAGNSIKVHVAYSQITGANALAGGFAEDEIQEQVNDVAGTTDWASTNINASANDEIHIVVEDSEGLISGVKNTILEVYEGLSLYADSLKNGGSNYFKTVINRDSKYIYVNGAGWSAAGNVFNSTGGKALPGESGLTSLKVFGSNIVATGVATMTYSAADNSRTAGTYLVKHDGSVVTSAGAGLGAEINVTIDSSGAATGTVSYAGVGYAGSDTIVIPASQIGGVGGNLTITVASIGSIDLQKNLRGGTDGTVTASTRDGNVTNALAFLADPAVVDVNLLFCEQTDGQTGAKGEIVTIAGTTRKDCVGFISPDTSAATASDVIGDLNYNSSYVVLDGGAVYVYNKYDDTYRYIHAAGHIAGLCARTDNTNDPWFSPAGYNRGNLLGITKLKWNPNQANRDMLYKKGVNPIISQPGQGILLFGDKTAQKKPSAFDRINVRRLFIVLEKAISTAAKFQLFELNDEFTRAMFRNMTEPFLRDVKGRRGITDFLVVCDETNNTGNIIDTNRFVADIYIKPARSINFITLNFVATRTGIEFSEIVGTGN